ncbi:MAG TPA: ATP synthase F1 subunit delta [Terracidiphilus sp.]|jgi:F-type H+-transporting ATPase subunit delta
MAAAFAARYARAFADVVASARLDAAALDRQLQDFLATWDGSAELREVFLNPAIPAVQKVAVLDKLNARMGLQRELRNLVAVLINHDRIGAVHEVAMAWRAEMQERLGIRQAEIVTARDLSEAERAELVAGVGKLAGSRIEPTFKQDPAILGGTVVRIGSTVWDGSVRGRLQRLRETLISG